MTQPGEDNRSEQAAPPTAPAPEALARLDASWYTASQWRLTWWKFLQHRLAVLAGVFLIIFYLTAAFCEFFAPCRLDRRDIPNSYSPPQRLHFVSEEGIHPWPFVYKLKVTRDPETLQKTYVEDRSRRYPIRLFTRGEPYRLWGIFPADRHLIGVDPGGTLFLLGTDGLGRDLFSNILYGARISLTIGLVGVAVSFVLGLTIGAASGYFGGWLDHLIQRLIEIIRSFPSIPLWMALAAAVPASWSPLQVYFGIVLVLSFIGWTGLARQVRGMILSAREEDYTMAAVVVGVRPWRVMWRHLLPSCTSHIIVVLTLAVPGMILGETALSFLGLGLRAPVTSWGVLLQESQNVQAVASYPWLLTPVVFVILAVLAFNFLGDGLRDAADPYKD